MEKMYGSSGNSVRVHGGNNRWYLDGCRVATHLLVPGFTYTGLIKRHVPEKPAAAWEPEQVVNYMLLKSRRS